MTMTQLRTPIVTIITGEGGCGGALALAVGDVVLALENSIYSVISPEGAASILWRSADYSQQAAVAMRLTAGEQLALGVIDEVVPRAGRAARTKIQTRGARRLRARIAAHLDALAGRERKALVEARYARYRRMGEFAVATRSRRGQGRATPGIRPHSAPARGWPCRQSPAVPRHCPIAMTDGEEQPPLREDV